MFAGRWRVDWGRDVEESFRLTSLECLETHDDCVDSLLKRFSGLFSEALGYAATVDGFNLCYEIAGFSGTVMGDHGDWPWVSDFANDS